MASCLSSKRQDSGPWSDHRLLRRRDWLAGAACRGGTRRHQSIAGAGGGAAPVGGLAACSRGQAARCREPIDRILAGLGGASTCSARCGSSETQEDIRSIGSCLSGWDAPSHNLPEELQLLATLLKRNNRELPICLCVCFDKLDARIVLVWMLTLVEAGDARGLLGQGHVMVVLPTNPRSTPPFISDRTHATVRGHVRQNTSHVYAQRTQHICNGIRQASGSQLGRLEMWL